MPSDRHAEFLSMLPRIELHGRVAFRHVKCPQHKADAIADMVALAWKWYCRLVERGKDPSSFVSTLASFAARAVHSGRRVTGQLKPKDVMSERAQAKHGFTISTLPDFSTLGTNPLAEALEDNRRSPVPDQVAFRFDFPAWLKSRPRRDRRIIQQMGMGERTSELSRRFGLSPARVSQLRREFACDWEQFTSTDDPNEQRSTAC